MFSSFLTDEISRAPRWNTFFAGLALNVVGIVVLIFVSSRMPTVATRVISNRNYVVLVAPVTAPPPDTLPVIAKLKLKLSPPQRPLPSKQVLPAPEAPKMAVAPAPATPLPIVPKPVAAPPQNSDQPAFASAQMPPEEKEMPRREREIKTGGFGDPNGLATRSDVKRNAMTMVSVGAFQSSAGAGKSGNAASTAGAAVQTAGFGSREVAGAAHAGSGREVVASSFGSRVAPNNSAGAQHLAQQSQVQPVEIIYKPRPVYTAEALRSRVEGEVLLDVVFSAAGSLHVDHVVKGLGYGLDDQALAVAQRIRFRPARKDGQPYDCAALVHIVFELAK
ncbi:MAG: TonB family protein [Terriglobales bacterium]